MQIQNGHIFQGKNGPITIKKYPLFISGKFFLAIKSTLSAIHIAIVTRRKKTKTSSVPTTLHTLSRIYFKIIKKMAKKSIKLHAIAIANSNNCNFELFYVTGLKK